MENQLKIDIQGRDAIADHANVASHIEINHAPVGGPAGVSIAIPTFRRPELLREAVASGLAQEGGQRCELVIVDNDPEGSIDHGLRNIITSQRHMNVRYYRNAENIGMFGNWNRAIALSQCDWITLLNDDDLLAPSFVARSFEALARVGGGEGIVCRNDTYDRRPNAHSIDKLAKETILSRFRTYLRFGRYDLARLTPRVLFFGNEAGNSAGFLFRRDIAVQIGGFLPEEWPASDYTFYVRFAIRARLYLFRPVLAHVGIGENESMRPETLAGFVAVLAAMRSALAGREVPAKWKSFNPQLISNLLLEIEEAWETQLDRKKIADELGVVLPGPSRRKILWKRLMLRAY